MSDKKFIYPLRTELNSPTFIATADIHLGKKLYNEPELEEDLKGNFVRLADITIAHKVQYLVIAGDLFEHNNMKPHMIAFVANTVDRLARAGIRTVGIAGDHDKPLREEAWVRIAKIDPVTVEPAFAGIDYFDYSSTTPDEIVNLLKIGKDPEKIQWIFLHCQFPQLFDAAEAKKIIDYNKLRLFENFPNIQGVIAGDIHFAPENYAYGVGKKAYVGYPGSPSVLDKSEYKHNKHVLYCDGRNLTHVPFPVARNMTEVDLRYDAESFDVTEVAEWCKLQPCKPLVYVTYDSDSEQHVHKVAPLYQYALVRLTQQRKGAVEDVADLDTSCRSEATTEDKVKYALQATCKNDEALLKLSHSLLTEDVKDTLDKFKEEFKL